MPFDKQFDKLFTALATYEPEVLGLPIFVVSGTADIDRSIYMDGRGMVTLICPPKPVTEFIPNSFVVLAEATPAAERTVLHIRCSWSEEMALEVVSSTSDSTGVYRPVIASTYEPSGNSGEMYYFARVAEALLCGGELVEAKPTLSRTASAIKRKPVYKLSYTTVQLPGVKSERKPHHGGTHASPRQHERRGHWRTYRSGKRVWVKNCVVGDPSLGHVKHAYVVTQGAPHG